MAMKTVALEQATGAALDLLVATCEGHLASVTKSGEVIILREGITDYFDPSRNWGWAGPIIERERIATLCPATGDFWDARDSKTFTKNPQYYRGPTPLIAAMRCYVASVMGETVEVPEELL